VFIYENNVHLKAPIPWVPGTLSRVMQLGYETDHSPPSSVKVKNKWSYNPIPPCMFILWAG